jgi:hypothetical protein
VPVNSQAATSSTTFRIGSRCGNTLFHLFFKGKHFLRILSLTDFIGFLAHSVFFWITTYDSCKHMLSVMHAVGIKQRSIK